jgi:hypothetical protein
MVCCLEGLHAVWNMKLPDSIHSQTLSRSHEVHKMNPPSHLCQLLNQQGDYDGIYCGCVRFGQADLRPNPSHTLGWNLNFPHFQIVIQFHAMYWSASITLEGKFRNQHAYVNTYMRENQQMHQLFIKFINCVWWLCGDLDHHAPRHWTPHAYPQYSIDCSLIEHLSEGTRNAPWGWQCNAETCRSYHT